ncbi:MAG: SO_0444 family Cu/Zn efflux transporter [Phycisphaerales bacterium JB037]
MLDWFSEFLAALWGIMLEAGVWLVVGFAIAGLIHVWLPKNLLRRVMGGKGLGPVARAAVIGAPMPLCSCSVIPTVASLRRSGAGKGASASFAIATPEVDAPSISITWAMIGPVMAIARPLVAIATAIAAGLSIDRWAGDRDPKTPSRGPDQPEPGSCCRTAPAPEPAKASCCGGGGTPATPTQAPFGERLREALWFSYAKLPADLGLWLVVGIVLSAAIMVAIPEGWIESNLESGALGPAGSKLLMLVIGVPWYVCATASTPLAAALIAKGLSPGAALVFLLAGPATNPATMGWVLQDLGKRALAIYLLSISLFALGAGFLLDAIFAATDLVPDATVTHEHGEPLARSIMAGALSVVLLIGFVRDVSDRVRRRISRGERSAGAAPAKSCCGGSETPVSLTSSPTR